MSDIATRLVYAAIARYEGRHFTPVMAVLMEDAANKAMRDTGLPIIVTVAGWLDASGQVRIHFKPRPPPAPYALVGGTVEMIKPDGTNVVIGTVSA